MFLHWGDNWSVGPSSDTALDSSKDSSQLPSAMNDETFKQANFAPWEVGYLKRRFIQYHGKNLVNSSFCPDLSFGGKRQESCQPSSLSLSCL